MTDIMDCLIGRGSIAVSDGLLEAASQFIFFQTINDFLRDEIDIMQWKLLSRSAEIIGFVSVTVMTVWIMFQGYRIVTGRSQQPMMMLVGDSLKATLLTLIAMGAAHSSSSIYWTLSDGMSSTIAEYVTGEDGSPFRHIDRNLAGMEVAMGIIDAIDTGDNNAAQDSKDRSRWFTGLGIAGPSVIAGSMLLLNKIALALFVGFGPIFIMCLLFEPTKQLFNKWLLYGIGTVFSLAVLSVMVTIAMRMMAAITVTFATKYLVSMPGMEGLGAAEATDGISSMALQQGGLGLLLTTMIISAPPMAAAFFQGTLGQFNSYSPFGHIKPQSPGYHGGGYGPPGSPTYMPGTNEQHASSGTFGAGGGFSGYPALGPSAYQPQPDEMKQKDAAYT